MSRKSLGISVYAAAKQRISRIFDTVPRIYLSFSGGKDSGVMMHLVCAEARSRKRKIGILFVDLEAQYQLTISYVKEMLELYADCIDPYWVALPLNLRNAVSQYEPQWRCWDVEKVQNWVRHPPSSAITSTTYFPWFRVGMEFEQLVDEFGKWYANGQLCCCFVGIRCDESLNRWRTIVMSKKKYQNLCWTTQKTEVLYTAYPLYDWKTRDIWIYNGISKATYNRIYDRMWAAGLTIHQARICQPYGDDQRRGLWLFHVLEPDTWAKVVARVNGANQGALYVRERGAILGYGKVSKPSHLTWEAFALLILGSLPEKVAEHYRIKISIFLKWYQSRGFPSGIPDEGPPFDKKTPSWTRICHVLLRNDYWCKGLSFAQTRPEDYEEYKRVMKKRSEQWAIL